MTVSQRWPPGALLSATMRSSHRDLPGRQTSSHSTTYFDSVIFLTSGTVRQTLSNCRQPQLEHPCEGSPAGQGKLMPRPTISAVIRSRMTITRGKASNAVWQGNGHANPVGGRWLSSPQDVPFLSAISIVQIRSIDRLAVLASRDTEVRPQSLRIRFARPLAKFDPWTFETRNKWLACCCPGRLEAYPTKRFGFGPSSPESHLLPYYHDHQLLLIRCCRDWCRTCGV